MKKYLEILLKEKNINTEDEEFHIKGESGINIMPLGVIIEHILITTKEEQNKIKNVLIEIDYKNGDILHFFEHLGKALAI